MKVKLGKWLLSFGLCFVMLFALFSMTVSLNVMAATSVTSIEIDVDDVPSLDVDYIIPSLYKVNGSSGKLDIITDWYVGWLCSETKTDNPSDYRSCYPDDEGFKLDMAYALYIEASVDSGYTFNNNMELKLNTPTGTIKGIVDRVYDRGQKINFYFFFEPVKKIPIKSVNIKVMNTVKVLIILVLK